MRIVLALSLLALQYAAGRPKGAPAPPTASVTSSPSLATARRGEGALLTNDLSGLLHKLLNQNDDNSPDIDKKKRLLEFTPISQKRGSKRPLIILAAEVPQQKHKKDSKNAKNKISKTLIKHKSKENDSEKKNMQIKVHDKFKNSAETIHSDSLEHEHEKHDMHDVKTEFIHLLNDLIHKVEQGHDQHHIDQNKSIDRSDNDNDSYNDDEEEENDQDNEINTETNHKHKPYKVNYETPDESDSGSRSSGESSEDKVITKSQEKKVKSEEDNQEIKFKTETYHKNTPHKVSDESQEQPDSESRNSEESINKESKMISKENKLKSKEESQDNELKIETNNKNQPHRESDKTQKQPDSASRNSGERSEDKVMTQSKEKKVKSEEDNHDNEGKMKTDHNKNTPHKLSDEIQDQSDAVSRNSDESLEYKDKIKSQENTENTEKTETNHTNRPPKVSKEDQEESASTSRNSGESFQKESKTNLVKTDEDNVVEASLQEKADDEEQSNSNEEVDKNKLSNESVHQSKSAEEDAPSPSSREYEKTREPNIETNEKDSPETNSLEKSHEIPEVDNEHERSKELRSDENGSDSVITLEVDSSFSDDDPYEDEASTSRSAEISETRPSIDSSLPDGNRDPKEFCHNIWNAEPGNNDEDASSTVDPPKIIKIIDDSKSQPPGHYGDVIRNANKGDVKELQKIYRLSFKFNK